MKPGKCHFLGGKQRLKSGKWTSGNRREKTWKTELSNLENDPRNIVATLKYAIKDNVPSDIPSISLGLSCFCFADFHLAQSNLGELRVWLEIHDLAFNFFFGFRWVLYHSPQLRPNRIDYMGCFE